MPSSLHLVLRLVMVPAIATSLTLPAIVQPAAAQSADLCRLTKTTTTRFQSDSLGSATLGKIPAGTPVVLVRSPDSRRSPLAEINVPRQFAGFVPIDALGPCTSADNPPPTTPKPPAITSVCRRVLAKAAPPGMPIKLRSKPLIPTDDPLSNVVGSVKESAFVYVVTDGKNVKSTNDGTHTWIQIDLKQTRTVNNAPGQFTIATATDPAEVWMFNTYVDSPKLSNLGMCPP